MLKPIRAYCTHAPRATRWKLLKHANARRRPALSPNEPNNGCGCSLMCRDIVEQFPGDICGESLGMPPHPFHHTHFSSSSTDPGHCCRQGPWTRDKKEAVVVSLQERWTPVFLLFLLPSLHTHRQGSKRGKSRKLTEWREERNLCTATLAFHNTTKAHPLHHQPHPQHPQ